MKKNSIYSLLFAGVLLLTGCGESNSTGTPVSVVGSDNGPTAVDVAGNIKESDVLVVSPQTKKVVYPVSDTGPTR